MNKNIVPMYHVNYPNCGCEVTLYAIHYGPYAFGECMHCRALIDAARDTRYDGIKRHWISTNAQGHWYDLSRKAAQEE